MPKTIPSVDSLLKKHGPLLTSDISKIYRKKGLSETAARQRVNRRSSSVQTLNGLPFPKRSKFLYLEGEFGSTQFFNALVLKLEETSPSYAAAISGLSARGGICLKNRWDIVSGAPVLQKKHIPSSEILRRFIDIKLLKEVTVAGIGECIVFNERISNVNYTAFRSRMTVEYILAESVRAWSVKVGFSSKNTISLADGVNLPKFSTFCFDLVGPSYLNALTKSKDTKVKPGFFLADVIWNDQLQEQQVKGFLYKVSTLKMLRNLPNFQPMLVANGYSHEAIMKCRSRGIITVTPEALFGRDIAQALIELLRTLERAAEVAIGNPEKIEQLFDAFSKIEGLDGNLRGSMFELIVGHMVRRLFATGSIDIGELVTDHETARKADIDVRRVDENAVTCYECKGKAPHSLVTMDEVKYWLEKQIPVIRGSQKYEQRFSNMTKIFEFWSTSSYTNDALEYLKERKSSISKYQIEWRDGEYVKDQASKLKNKTIIRILNQYYFNNPVSKILNTNGN